MGGWVGGWVDGWMDGWVEIKEAVLMMVNSNKAPPKEKHVPG